MSEQEHRALNAIWKSTSENHHEKLILAYLAGKHELGEKYSSSWKPIESFIADFQERWCDLKELKDSTQLSDAKLNRALKSLAERKLIKLGERSIRTKKQAEGVEGPKEATAAITLQIFNNYSQQLRAGKTQHANAKSA